MRRQKANLVAIDSSLQSSETAEDSNPPDFPRIAEFGFKGGLKYTWNPGENFIVVHWALSIQKIAARLNLLNMTRRSENPTQPRRKNPPRGQNTARSVDPPRRPASKFWLESDCPADIGACSAT